MRIAALLCFALTLPAAADTKVWLVGGGNTLETSQDQIESNVRWLEQWLEREGLAVRTYFGIGHAPGPDVVYRSGAPAPRDAEMLARIFGDYSSIGLQHRRHELLALQGGTAKAELTAALERDFAALADGDELLFVYNGHGGLDADDTRNNYLKLWGDERLTVAELEQLFDAVPTGVPTRFVLTQCYAGAFQSLIYDDPLDESGFRGERCGFMAESATRLAEGCSLTAGQDDFRDYTTYFFAALSGATRGGERLPTSALDRDADGAVSFREAHHYALAASVSADLPRSTSEEYLERWSPWFVQLDSLADNPDSVYWQLAEEVAAAQGWSTTPDDLAARYREHAAAMRESDEQRRDLRREIEAQRKVIQNGLGERWPAAVTREPQAAVVATAVPPIDAQLPALAAELATDDRYANLVRLQDSLRPLADEARERARMLTQVEKIYRLRHLARLERALARYGGAEEQRRYVALQQCEAGTLQGPR